MRKAALKDEDKYSATSAVSPLCAGKFKCMVGDWGMRGGSHNLAFDTFPTINSLASLNRQSKIKFLSAILCARYLIKGNVLRQDDQFATRNITACAAKSREKPTKIRTRISFLWD